MTTKSFHCSLLRTIMIFGDAARFAIEFDFDQHPEEPKRRRFGFGHARFLRNGSTVGDLEEYSSLGTIAWALQSSVDNRPRRCAIDVCCEAAAAAVFSELDWVVYGVGRDDDSLWVEDPTEKTYCYCVVHPSVNARGHPKMVAIECEAVQRVIWHDLGGDIR